MATAGRRILRAPDAGWQVPVALFLVTLVPRIVLFLIGRLWDPTLAGSILAGDAVGYHQRALTVFGPLGFYPPDIAIDYIRPPLFPILIALVYWLGGVHPWHVLIGHAVLAGITCVVLYRAAKDAIGPGAAVLMGLAFALDPTLVLLSNLLLSEVLFLFCCALALWCLREPLANGLQPRSLGALAAGGLCLGLATLTRPAGQLVPLFLVPAFFLARPRSFTRPLLAALLVGVVCLGAVTPWMMRNRAAFGVSSISEIQSWSPFFKVLVGPVEAARTGESTDQVESRLARETATLARADGVDPDTLNAFRLAPYWRRLTWRYIAADPLTYARLGARRAVLFFANIGTVGYAGVLHLRGGGTDVALWRNLPLSQLVREWVTRKTPGEKAIALWLSLWLLLSYVCLVVGLWVALRRGAGPFLMGCLFVAFYFIVAGASVGEGRFRTSAFLFYLPFVGIGAQWLWSRRPGAAPAAARSAGRQGRAAPDEAGSRRPDVP